MKLVIDALNATDRYILNKGEDILKASKGRNWDWRDSERANRADN